MKDLCSHNCCAVKGAMYVTPWCDMLRGKDSSCSVLHLWYKLPMIQKEIDKRTSYLGKFRRTEEAQHLLDLLRMSKDETDLFIPFAKAAMADVSDALRIYMPKHDIAYWWREGQETVIIHSSDITPDPDVLHLSQLSEVDDEGFLIADNIPVDEEGYIKIAETAVDEDGYIIGDGSEVEPIPFVAGQYVMLDDNLYIAIEDGDSSDMTGKLVPTEDYRNSIHFGILWHCSYNPNAVEPLDVAVFEALVARIIYKWIVMAYPDEAVRYNAEFDEHMMKIRDRARAMEGPQIVNRIPRMF